MSPGSAREFQFTLDYDSEADYFVQKMRGVVTTSDIINAMAALRQHPVFKEDSRVLWDMSEADFGAIHLDEIRDFAGRAEARMLQPKRQAKIACVGESDMQFAVIRQILATAGWDDEYVKVTRSLATATEFLIA
ncbi:MAG: hypothetical protein ACE37D_07160 [Pseudomonadales bacterium]